MKKHIKGFVLGLIVASLLMGTVFGAGFQETIEVLFNSINLYVDGTIAGKAGEDYTLTNGEKVPYSILYKGTTYLPIRKVSEILNKDLDWNGKTRTAGISGGNIDSGQYSKADVEKLKIYSRIATNYYEIQMLADSILKISEKLDISYYIIKNFKDSVTLDPTLEYINYVIDKNEGRINITEKLELEANAYGIDVSDMYFSLDKTSEALEYYEKAFNSLKNYSLNRKKEEIDNYTKYYEKAEITVYQQENLGMLGNYTYYHLIKEY